MRNSGILATAIVVALVLTACGQTVPTPTPTPTGSGSPSAEPTPLDRAEPVLPLTCDELIPRSVLTAAVPRAQVGFDGTGAVATLDEAVERQVGILSCAWFQPEADFSFLVVDVIPDPTAFDHYDGWMEVDRQYVDVDRFGDASRDTCGFGYCQAHIRVADYAVFVRIGIASEDPARVDAALTALAAAVAGAPAARPRWQSPAGVLTPASRWCETGSDVLAVLAQATGARGLRQVGSDAYPLSWMYTREHSGDQLCALTSESNDDGSWHVIPGGAWAFRDLVDDPDAGVQAREDVEVSVRESAAVEGGLVIVAVSERRATVTLPVDGSLVSFSWAGLSSDDALELVPQVIAAARATAG